MTLDLEAIEKRLTERFGASNDGTWRDIAPLIAEVRRLREKLAERQEVKAHVERMLENPEYVAALQRDETVVVALEAQVKRYRGALRGVAGIRDRCCGWGDNPLAWCIHDDARSALSDLPEQETQ